VRPVALIDSPFQLLSLFEAVHAGAVDPPSLVLRSTAVPPRLVELGADLVGDVAPAGTSSSEVVRLVSRARRVVVGDVLSTFVQGLLVSLRLRDVTVLEDGAAFLRAVATLADGTGPLCRAHRRRPVDLVLGRAARARLSRHAAAGRVTIFGCLPVSPSHRRHLLDHGYRMVGHRFEWTRGQRIASSDRERPEQVLVLGSSLAADGFVDGSWYERWRDEALSAEVAVLFAPHRREPPVRRAGVSIAELAPQLPIELGVLAMPALREVRSLPGTAALTLPLVVPHCRVECGRVPDGAWSPQVPGEMRHLLDLITDEVDLAAGRAG